MTPELKIKLFWLNNRRLPYLLATLFIVSMVLLQLETGVFVR
jgi:hypothetical protein